MCEVSEVTHTASVFELHCNNHLIPLHSFTSVWMHFHKYMSDAGPFNHGFKKIKLMSSAVIPFSGVLGEKSTI